MENQPNPEETGQLNPEEGQQEGEAGTANTETPEEPAGEEKLYAGRFKTPEELEEAYKLSSNEGIRLAGEVKRLTTEFQQAQTPVEKEEVRDKINDLSQHFDEDTAKILENYVNNRLETKIAEMGQSNKAQSEFESEVSENWEETKKLYPDVANPQSKLYLRANEIMFERKLAELEADGTVKLLTPFAYRIAVEAADSELSRQATEAAPNQTKKSQAGIVQGKGSKTVSQGKLTYEEYNKLSDDEKDAYDSRPK